MKLQEQLLAQQEKQAENGGIPMPAPTAGGNPKPTGATAKPGLKKANSDGQKTEQDIKEEKKDKKQ